MLIKKNKRNPNPNRIYSISTALRSVSVYVFLRLALDGEPGSLRDLQLQISIILLYY